MVTKYLCASLTLPGIIDKSTLTKKLLDNYPPRVRDILISILVKFEIIYPLNGRLYVICCLRLDRYLIPCILTLDPPLEFVHEKKKFDEDFPPLNYHKLERHTTFSFVPVYFFSRLVVRVLSMIKNTSSSVNYVSGCRDGLVVRLGTEEGFVP